MSKIANCQRGLPRRDAVLWDIFTGYEMLMQIWREKYRPVCAVQPLDRRFVYALKHTDYATYLIDYFLAASDEERETMADEAVQINAFLVETTRPGCA